ncbi:MAG: LPS export ABC transporter permease LptF [Betaproteobacteria bacterium]|nr:LPS export ABC transporter permease LptF [Betaproteobacteria bacterium]
MIFHRALLRELAGFAVAVFLTLFAISLTTQLVRLLGQAAGGEIPSDAVLAYLGFFAINVLPVLLSLTLFVTVLLTLTRSYRDSEMVIWFGSGLSLAAWFRPVMTFAAPIVMLVALLSLVVAPWAAGIGEQYRSRLDARSDVSRVEPGVFGESLDKDRVFFVESIAGDKSAVQNVFVSSVQQGRTGIMMSRRGFTETAPNGDRFLVLLDGNRYEGTPGEADFRIMHFGRYATRIEAQAGPTPEATVRALSTLALARDPTAGNLGELVWRIGVPLSALILAMLAVPLSFVNPRGGRSVNLPFALLIYIVYSNLLSVSQARVGQGKLAFSVGWWLVHALMIVLLTLLFARRVSLFRLRLGG